MSPDFKMSDFHGSLPQSAALFPHRVGDAHLHFQGRPTANSCLLGQLRVRHRLVRR